MILEGKKLTAFDAIEAAMQLSDMYREHNVNKSISCAFYGRIPCVDFFVHDYADNSADSTIRISVYLDDVTYGDSFSDVFTMIENEMDKITGDKKEKANEIQSA